MPDKFRSQVFEPGTRIFREGEPGQQAYIIERGAVEISAYRNGETAVVARLAPGEIFGEMALIDDELRSATAVAVEETELIVIQRDQLMQPMDKADPMVTLLLRMILERFRTTQRQLSNGGAEPAAELLELDVRDGALDEIREQAIERIKLDQDIRQAIDKKEFELYYQPIIALEGGHMVGLEALMRWHHEERGFVSPVEFIGPAEESGAIVEMGRWALEEALTQNAGFQALFAKAFPDLPPLFMSVNVSGRQLISLEEIDNMVGIIEAAGADPVTVKLEITETLMVEDPVHATLALERLKGYGVSLAIDDFGTGYSSLSYLHRFPLDTLKIDRSFVSNREEVAGSRRIVRSIARLAQDLEMDIVAEGIEKTEQMAMLRDLGCTYGQGYLMSKPVPKSEIDELIESGVTW